MVFEAVNHLDTSLTEASVLATQSNLPVIDISDRMNEVRTRTQTVQAANPDTQRLNGHANPPAHGREPEAPENIFLFYPNIIGEQRRLEILTYNQELNLGC